MGNLNRGVDEFISNYSVKTQISRVFVTFEVVSTLRERSHLRYSDFSVESYLFLFFSFFFFNSRRIVTFSFDLESSYERVNSLSHAEEISSSFLAREISSLIRQSPIFPNA